MRDITASIVLYNTPMSEINLTLKTLLGARRLKHIYIIDNSPIPLLSNVEYNNKFTTYIFCNKNLGYGKAHNIAIQETLLRNTKYHIVLNTDMEFSSGIIETLGGYMDSNSSVGQIMPKVLNLDGSIQDLCKLIPTPFDLLARRFLPKNLFNKRHDRFTLKGADFNKIMNIPNLSGCFMFLRSSVLSEIGIFDEQFLLYAEDMDLTRRIHSKYKTIFFPKTTVIHYAKHESYSNPTVMLIHVASLIKYFNKWGWFNDKERDYTNLRILNKYISCNPNQLSMTLDNSSYKI
ncbi:glycosyltransferase family 2 protein [Prolixibacteraceae bacterium]|nr:glycosyltransferase family 2 protein [Prolixibacteraceae bacterium]